MQLKIVCIYVTHTVRVCSINRGGETIGVTTSSFVSLDKSIHLSAN